MANVKISELTALVGDAATTDEVVINSSGTTYKGTLSQFTPGLLYASEAQARAGVATGVVMDALQTANAINELAGDVVGPASATDDSLARFDGTTGKLLKNGAVIGVDVQAYDADTTKNDTANIFTKTQTWTKGSDVASATNIVLGDGNSFDITGTTTIATIGAKGVGTVVNLTFDGVVTLTQSADIDFTGINGGSDYTTTAGETLTFLEHAAGDWRCINASLSASGGGNLVLIGTVEASASANLTITGLDSTYDSYLITFSDIVPATASVFPWFRVGDSGGVDSGASDYISGTTTRLLDGTNIFNETYGTNSAIRLIGTNNIENTNNISFNGQLWLHQPSDSSNRPFFNWTATYGNAGKPEHVYGGGERTAVINLDRLQLLMSSGNITSGRMTVWGLKHD